MPESMSGLTNIARPAVPSKGTQFRKLPYGPSGIDSFLRYVLALANMSVDGPRYVVIDIDFDNRGHRRFAARNAGTART